MKINQTENRYNRLKVRLLRLAIVVFFIGLSVQIELFDLTLFGISQSLSTTFIVMMLTMLVPCFFVSELLAFVYKNRFVLMPVALFFIGGALSAFYSPFPLAYSSQMVDKIRFLLRNRVCAGIPYFPGSPIGDIFSKDADRHFDFNGSCRRHRGQSRRSRRLPVRPFQKR